MGKEQELLEAARNGNCTVVERILNHRTKKSGPLASLRRGPGPNTQDATGYTCLHHAALNGRKDVVKLLLQYDANPNVVDNKGSTALHLASWTGNYEIVHAILTSSSIVPNVNLKNNNQEIALHCAAQYGHSSVVCILLQHGSDASIRNNKGESPLDLASQYGRYESVDILLRTRPSLVRDLIDKHSPLHLAARNGHRNVVQLLLNAKFDVNYITEKGSALHEAALYGKIGVVKLLLDYGINIDAEDDQKRTVSDLLNDLNTHLAKQIRHIIKEHGSLVSVEDDYSGMMSDSSSHCISPPPGYTDVTPEHNRYANILLPRDYPQSPSSDITSPANSEFNFYEVPSIQRLSTHNKRSSGDDYKATKNVFSRSQNSILDGLSTSSRSPSFIDYGNGPPVPPRERLSLSRISKSVDSPHNNYHPLSLMTSNYDGYGSISRINDDLPTGLVSSNSTWSNAPSKYGKPIPPAKPPRKPALGSCSKSQHHLHITSKNSDYNYDGDGTMKRSISNEGESYEKTRIAPLISSEKGNAYNNSKILSESAYSVLYDDLTTEDHSIDETNQIFTGQRSEHHPYCPNYDDEMKSDDPPSPSSAQQKINSVIEPLFENEDLFFDACSDIQDDWCNWDDNITSPFDYESDDYNDNEEYKKTNKHLENIEIITEDGYFSTFDNNGKKIYVRLRNSKNLSRDKCVATEGDSSLIESENLLEGLYRGSANFRKSEILQDGRKSLRKTRTIDRNTLERKRRGKSNSIKMKNEEKVETENYTTITIKPIEIETECDARSSSSLLSCNFDENKEWAEIANIMASFGSDLAETRDDIISSLELPDQIKSVQDWLNDLGLGEYYNILMENGFDDLNFMGSNLMEDSELLEIGIVDQSHREKLLKAAKNFPKLNQLDKDLKISLEKWLESLGLLNYLETFKENGFDNMDRVWKIWEVELNAILEIKKIGHKKRILVSLGERLSLVTDLGLEDLDFNRLHSAFGNIEIKKTQDEKEETLQRKEHDVEDETLETSHSPTDTARSEDDKLSISSDWKCEIDKMEETSKRSSTSCATPLATQWKHDPFELYKGECDYKALYLGSTLVTKLQGINSTKESIKKLKESTKDIQKIPTVILSISYTGVKFIDAQSNQMVCEHRIRNIHCACQDADDFKHFAYITKEHETKNNYCHVFCANNLDVATEIILTLGQAFDVAYQIALGDDIKTISDRYKEQIFKPPSPPPRTSSYSIGKCIKDNTNTTDGKDTNNTHNLEDDPKKETKSMSKCLGNKEAKSNLKTSEDTNSQNQTKNSYPLISPIPPKKPEKPVIRTKPSVPIKPASLIKACPSPGSTLTRRVKQS